MDGKSADLYQQFLKKDIDFGKKFRALQCFY